MVAMGEPPSRSPRPSRSLPRWALPWIVVSEKRLTCSASYRLGVRLINRRCSLLRDCGGWDQALRNMLPRRAIPVQMIRAVAAKSTVMPLSPNGFMLERAKARPDGQPRSRVFGRLCRFSKNSREGQSYFRGALQGRRGVRGTENSNPSSSTVSQFRTHPRYSIRNPGTRCPTLVRAFTRSKTSSEPVPNSGRWVSGR